MYTDSREHTISTNEESAARACAGAIESILARRSNVMPQLQAAIDADPTCVLAHTLNGLMIASLRKTAMIPAVRKSFDTAQSLSRSATEREQHFLQALQHVLSGRPEDAVACYQRILGKHPTDLLALTMAQGELFWMGQMDRSLALSESVQSSWSDDIPGYSVFLSTRSFDLEEQGMFEQAELLGKESVELDETNPWGAHSVAHVLLMQHRIDEGLSWLDGLSDNWSDVGQMKFHLWWHQCLFHIEQQNHEAALSIHDSWLRNREHPLTKALPDFYLDLQNGASLLWRLEAAGVDVGDRWLELSEAVLPNYTDMTSPFTSAHKALILAAADRYDVCQTLIQTMKTFINGHSGTIAEGYKAAISVAEASVMHRSGDFAGALAVLLPRRSDLWQMGGSHAQQEVFYQLAYDAARQLERHDEMNLLSNDLERLGFVNMENRAAYRH